jgi:outer membrane lipoprotein-sorting protein
MESLHAPPRTRLALLGCLCLFATVSKAEPSPAATWLPAWFSAQTNLLTWSADVLQTRSLKTLAQPLQSRGRVWFAAPNRFRWELVEPSSTIAVREPDQLIVIYPRLKRAERYPLRGAEAGPWKDTLALLEAGFPRSQAELETRFRILAQSLTGQVCEVTLQPKSAAARRLMPQIKVAFSTNDLALRATELQFADGSTLRNEFSHAHLNPRLDESVFTPPLDADFKIVEPMKR